MIDWRVRGRMEAGNKRDFLKKGYLWAKEKPGVRENPRNTQG